MSEQPPEEAKKPAEVVAADTTTELGTPVAGATTTATPSVHIYDTCPPEKTNLRILLVSGQKTDIPALPSDTVESFLNNCFDQWPLEWKKDKSIISPESAANLKLLHRGKFAEKATTLESNGFNIGLTTVVHILVKNDAASNGAGNGSGDEGKGENGREATCRCTIL